MIVYLLRSGEMITVQLPLKVNGYYPIETTVGPGMSELILTIAAKDGHWILHPDPGCIPDADRLEGTPLLPNVPIELEHFDGDRILLYPAMEDAAAGTFRYFAVGYHERVTVGSGEDCTIRCRFGPAGPQSFAIRMDGERCTVENLEFDPRRSLYRAVVDGTVVNGTAFAGVGSAVTYFGLRILIGPGFLAVNLTDDTAEVALPVLERAEMHTLSESERLRLAEGGDPLFSSAPRVYHHEERQTLKVESPPQKQSDDETPWAVMLGPALTMSAGTLFASFMTMQNLLASGNSISGALPSLVMSVTMVGGMAVWPTIGRKIQRRRREEQRLHAETDYTNYLQWLVAEIKRLSDQQISFANQNNPSLEECIGTIYQARSNLWERSEKHDDFLRVMIGRGSLPLNVEFSYPERSYSTEITESARMMYNIMEQDYTVQNVPITLPLNNSGVIGVVGARQNVLRFARALIVELTTLHNYEDLRLVFVYDPAEEREWHFAKWVNHVWDHAGGFRCIASTPEEVKTLNDYLQQRAKKTDRNEKQGTHYVIIAASRKLAERSTVIPQLYRPDFCDNMTVVTLYDQKQYLPKECRFVVELHDAYTASLLDYDDVTGHVQYCDSYVSCSDDVEPLFIRMSNIRLGGMEHVSALPTHYTLTEMCGVGRMEQIDLMERWKRADPVESLRAQIGIDRNGYPIYLDVHEKAHGPHGLIAGMTGSGKSEFIISYIASMAMNYSPEDVAFVLIDFKGGGMADVFKDLPHTAGLITNLDGNELKRSFMAIESELQKRQRLFKEISEQKTISNIDIYKYQKLRQSDPTLKPLPHLILISDEFAELKQQHRDFMEQLVRIARIGRSLGVHLILATQKPDGVVDDQIKSNIRFRVCLKVQDRNDSKTMIGRPDAADITNAGRFYYLVGNDEIFEYGQSPWSGATYVPSDRLVQNIGTGVTVLNHQGQTILHETVTPQRRDTSAPEKQIDALVDYISDVAASAELAAGKLWLKPLQGPEQEQFREQEETYSVQPFVICPNVGMYDDLENQRHLPLYIPFTGGGNTLLYGAAGTGALEFINAMLMDLLRSHGAEELNLYLIDYDAGTLSAFEPAPHTKRFANSTGAGNASAIIREVQEILESRKESLKEYGGDFQNFIRTSGETMPNVLLVIHNYQNFADSDPDVRSNLISLARQGTQYGVFLFLTGTTGSSIPYAMQPLFHNVYTLQQNTEEQYREILGKTGGMVPANYRGRGLTRIGGSVCEFQTAMVFADSENAFRDIQAFCVDLRGDDYEPEQAPTEERTYTWSDYLALQPGNTPEALPIAIDPETGTVRTLSLFDQVATLMLFDDLGSETHSGVLKLLRESGAALNYMGTEKALMHLPGWSAIRPTSFGDEIRALWNAMLSRASEGQAAKAAGQPLPDFEREIYVIDGVSTVLDWLDEDARTKLVTMLGGLSTAYHIHFVLLDAADQSGGLLGPTGLKNGMPYAQGLLMGEEPIASMLFGAETDPAQEGETVLYQNGVRARAQIISLKEGRL